MPAPTVIESYRFDPADLAVEQRLPGISGFLRVRNGADFVEAAVRSHLPYVDEIVAVFNQCTDATPAILARLAAEFPDKLRVFDYRPTVFPPGSDGHASEPPNSPHSLVNYYNFALAQTRRNVAFKVDDDHIAMPGPFSRLIDEVRSDWLADGRFLCFSGINVATGTDGRLGVALLDPLVGLGDHAFFRVTASTYFTHDRRFERLRAGRFRRVFRGIAYWHLKYLKEAFGFANYGIEAGTNERYRRKRDAFVANRAVVSLAELTAMASRKRKIAIGETARLRAAAWRAVAAGVVTDQDLSLLARTLSMPQQAKDPRA